MGDKICKTPDCGQPARCRGLCDRCYGREYMQEKRRKKRQASSAPSGPILPMPAPLGNRKRVPKPAPESSPGAQPRPLSARVRKALARTATGRAAIDASIAGLEPDPGIDELPVIVFGKPRPGTRRSTKLKPWGSDGPQLPSASAAAEAGKRTRSNNIMELRRSVAEVAEEAQVEFSIANDIEP